MWYTVGALVGLVGVALGAYMGWGLLIGLGYGLIIVLWLECDREDD